VNDEQTEGRSKESVPEKSGILDKSNAENEAKNETKNKLIEARSEVSDPEKPGILDTSNEKTETKNETIDPRLPVQKPQSILIILGLAALVAGLVVSILVNISLLTIGGDHASNISLFQWVVITGALLITAISLGISFWLYYVRTLYIKDGPALVPEKWGAIIAELSHVTNQSNINTVSKLTSLLKDSSHLTDKSETLLESFLTLQDTISNRDAEINRLKKGHDSKIFRRFIVRFIRVSNALQEIRKEAKDSDQAKNYKYLCRLIQSALDECGVEQLFPEIGSDYRQLGVEVDDDPEVIETNDALKNYHIASVETPAYMIEGEGGRDIIFSATVTIYKTKEKELL
jgi:hypothetical protein